jgi:hypothetical protein
VTPPIHPSRPRIFVLNPGPVRESFDGAPRECRFVVACYMTAEETGMPPVVLCYSESWTPAQLSEARRLHAMTAADYAAETRGLPPVKKRGGAP